MKMRVTTLLLVLLSFNTMACESDKDWKIVFADPGAGDWREHWFVEGLKATVEYEESSLLFTSGPAPKEQASHAVLWTKKNFTGDVRIEYDYTRLDLMTDTTAVNILYIQATGLGTEASPTDIFLSTG